MFSFFRPKEDETRSLIREHVQLVHQTLEHFQDLVFAFLNEEENYSDLAYDVHDLEHEADSYRREVERALYRGAFFPMLREDYIKLAENIDDVANMALETGDMIVLQKPFIHPELENEVKELTREVASTYRPMTRLIESLDRGDSEAGREYIQKIQSGERSVDDVEWFVLRETFKIDDLTLAQKLHMRDLVNKIAHIADQVETVADRANMIFSKRNL